MTHVGLCRPIIFFFFFFESNSFFFVVFWRVKMKEFAVGDSGFLSFFPWRQKWKTTNGESRESRGARKLLRAESISFWPSYYYDDDDDEDSSIFKTGLFTRSHILGATISLCFKSLFLLIYSVLREKPNSLDEFLNMLSAVLMMGSFRSSSTLN